MAELKKFTRKEISEKNSENEIVFIIHNVVYDVTRFADEHPGGHGVLFDEAGTDASEKFVEIGHSADARDLMNKYAVGELVDEDKVQLKKRQVGAAAAAAAHPAAAAGSAAHPAAAAAAATHPAVVAAATTAAAEPGFLSTWKFSFLMGVLVTVLYNYLLG